MNTSQNLNSNNIIFKKNYLNNKCFSYFDKNKNPSTIEHSQSELMPKNGIDTTRSECKSYEESCDDTQNTIKSFSLNKSLRHFCTRYPRKMKRTKTYRKKFDESKRKEKKKEKKEKKKNKIMQLKKEKSEIIQSLKVLLQKKEQIKKENALKNNMDKDNNVNNNYKTLINDNEKKIFVNKVKTDDLNKIIINENHNKRIRRRNLDISKEDEIINNNNNNNDNLNGQLQKIYVKKNQDFLQKGDKNSIRNKYKNKKYETINV